MDTGDCQISISNEQSSYSLDENKLKQISAVALNCLGLSSYELSIRFVSSEEICRLNTDFRNKPQPTDVLSFPQLSLSQPITLDKPARPADWEVPELLGDIVISLGDANKNATEIGQTLSKETAFLLVHGILHLAGHDHINPEEEKLMLDQQRKLMNKLEKAASSPLWQDCVAELN